jgi:hypothetical protein
MERITLVDNSRAEGMQEVLGMNLSTHDTEYHIIIGCGGIGMWLGLLLAMMGQQYFVFMDGDKVDNTNLSRLPVPQTWVGINKAVALRKLIRIMRPDTVISCLTTHINEDTLHLLEQFSGKLDGGKYRRYNAQDIINVWDTTDDARIQKRISKYVDTMKNKYNKCRYRKIGYEGFQVGNYANMSKMWIPEDYQGGGYRTTQANAVSSVISAGLGIFANYLNNKDMNIDLYKLIKGEPHDMDNRTEATSSRRV